MTNRTILLLEVIQILKMGGWPRRSRTTWLRQWDTVKNEFCPKILTEGLQNRAIIQLAVERIRGMSPSGKNI